MVEAVASALPASYDLPALARSGPLSTPMNRQLFQYHPIIGYTFVPGLKTRVAHEGGGYLIKVNEAGFRANREFE